MIYSPSLTRRQLQNRFSKLQKLNYNQFRWWRMYESKNKPLKGKASFRDRILNGDYEVSCYLDQARWCEHEINDLYERYKNDDVQLSENTKMWKARRSRLIEDYDREELEKLTAITNGFHQNFQITKDEVKKEMVNCRGSLIDLYYIIEEKYKIKYIIHEKRGRPKKNP